jgi:hypothetical protein
MMVISISYVCFVLGLLVLALATLGTVNLLLRWIYWSVTEVATLLKAPTWFCEYVVYRDEIQQWLTEQKKHCPKPRRVWRPWRNQ